MSERRYKVGLDRQQAMLLPASIDDYVSPANLVRAIDAYVNSLDVKKLGMTNTEAESGKGGQPAYPPEMLLNLYLYGYLNRIRSSRMLERETRRNVELIWLLEGFKPSHAAIANFRKDNVKALKGVNRDFVCLCRELDLYGGKEVGLDGTFMKGNASKASIHTQDKLEKELSKIDKAIENYLEEVDKNDASESALAPLEDAALPEKLEKLKQRQAKCKERLEKLEANGAKQLSETDPDARLLKKNNQTVAGYHVQIAVDSKHKLLVDVEVTQDGNDSQPLAPMALRAKEILKVEELMADADCGFYNQEQIKQCVDNGITPYVAIPNLDKRTQKEGRFSRCEFQYDKEADRYQCPAGESLIRQGQRNQDGKILWKYVSKESVCAGCKFATKCLPEKTPYRQLYRWEHEAVIDAHKQRMKEHGREHMRTRASLAEHPFGTMKCEMGWRHFLTRGLEKVRGEMSLQMLSYNFKRALNVLGIAAFKNHLTQRVMAA